MFSPACAEFVKTPYTPVEAVGFDVAKGLLTAKFAPQLPRAARTAAAAACNGDGNGFPGQQR